MKKSLLIALFAALPLMAQEPADVQAPAGQAAAAEQAADNAQGAPCAGQCKGGHRHHKGGKGCHKMSPEQREAMEAKMLEKFDADKDGKLSDEERQAARESFRQAHEARRAEMLEKFDADKDGKLSDEERAEMRKNCPRPEGMRPEGRPRHAGKGKCGEGQGKRHGGKCGCPKNAPAES